MVTPAATPHPAPPDGPGGVPFDRVPGEVLPGDHLVIRVPGIAAVIRTGDLTGADPGAAATPLSGAALSTATELLELLRAVADEHGAAPGRPLAHRLTRWVVGTPGVPGFGTVAATDDGIAVFLHGDISLVEFPTTGASGSVSATGRSVTPAVDLVHLSGRTAAFTVDRLLPWPAGAIALSANDDPVRPPASPFAALGFGGLVNGLVPGDGIVLDPAAVPDGHRDQPDGPAGRHAAPAPPIAAPAVTPVPRAGDAEAAAVLPVAATPVSPPATSTPLPPPRLSARIDTSHDDVAPRRPLPVAGMPATPPADPARPDERADRGPGKPAVPPGKSAKSGPPVPAHAIVKGFRCSRGHLNDPRVSFCSVCGIRMDQVTGILVDGRRPPLGLLVLDIGATFVLDDDYVLGRNPESDPEVLAGRLRPIRLDDDSGTLSRVHAEIRLQNWDVVLVDRGSANGSYVAAAGQAGWTRLAPRQPVVLTPGLTVRVGRRTFTFESSAARL